MSEILIGCRGWDHDGWVPGFYPDTLPRDWRFCYYSNEIRSALVPMDDWARAAPETIVQWRADCDPAFRFVFEVAADSLDQDGSVWRRLHAKLAPLSDRTAAFVLRGAAETTALAAIASATPGLDLCLDQRPRITDDAAWDTLRHRLRLARTWRPVSGALAEDAGGGVIALADSLAPRQMRTVLETLSGIGERNLLSALFFTSPDNGYTLARDARTLAELMGL